MPFNFSLGPYLWVIILLRTEIMKPLLPFRNARPRWLERNSVFRNFIAGTCTGLILSHFPMPWTHALRLNVCFALQTIRQNFSVSGDSAFLLLQHLNEYSPDSAGIYVHASIYKQPDDRSLHQGRIGLIFSIKFTVILSIEQREDKEFFKKPMIEKGVSLWTKKNG